MPQHCRVLASLAGSIPWLSPLLGGGDKINTLLLPPPALTRPGFSEGIPKLSPTGIRETTGDFCETNGALVSLAGFQTQHLRSQGAWHDLVQGLFISCSVKVPFTDLNKQLRSNSGSPPAALNQRKLLLYFITLLANLN